MPLKLRTVGTGDEAPLFTLPTHLGDFSLASHKGRNHVILTFFRGTW